jgi:small GTP-binding protein
MAEENELPSIKITLIGNPGVGKTCIISKYLDNVFEENSSSTIGANYTEKVIKKNNKEYQLDIWDTAGQEQFQSLGKHFYKDSYIVCLVYDITSQESLDSLKEIWYPNLRKFGEKYTVLAVVANKSDLYETDDLANEKQAKEFANEIKGIWMSTSAKTGDGIDKLFDTMVDKYLNPEFNAKVSQTRGGQTGVKLHMDDSNKKPKKKFVKNQNFIVLIIKYIA